MIGDGGILGSSHSVVQRVMSVLVSAHMRSDRDLILTPPKWRDVLRDELVATGFDHDAAGVIARRVIERLVRHYLAGDPPATAQLDEAA